MPKFVSGFNGIPELESADPYVQKIFLLENNGKKEHLKAIYDINDAKYETYLERKTANHIVFTLDLKNDVGHTMTRNKYLKKFYIHMLYHRTKLLKKLREQDAAAYERMIEDWSIPHLIDQQKQVYKSRKYKLNVSLKKRLDLDDLEVMTSGGIPNP